MFEVANLQLTYHNKMELGTQYTYCHLQYEIKHDSSQIISFLKNIHPNISIKKTNIEYVYDIPYYNSLEYLIDQQLWRHSSLFFSEDSYDQSDLIPETKIGTDILTINVGNIPTLQQLHTNKTVQKYYISYLYNRPTNYRYYHLVIRALEALIKSNKFDDWMQIYYQQESVIDILT